MRQGQHIHKKHAVVIGAGYSGIVCATALARHYPKVTVIEQRDPQHPSQPPSTLQKTQRNHDAVPLSVQGNPLHPPPLLSQRLFTQKDHQVHAHLLMPEGVRALEQLLRQRLSKALGGEKLDLAHDVERFDGVAWRCRQRSSLWAYSCTLPALEHSLRLLLFERRNVKLLPCMRVEGLQAHQAESATPHIRGIIISQQGSRNHQERTCATLPADLVVDASGSRSCIGQWLHDLGYPLPPLMQQTSHMTLASGHYQIPEALHPSWRVLILEPPAQMPPRYGMVIALPDRSYLVTLISEDGEAVPSTPEAFLRFARGLSQNHLYRFLQAATPITHPITHRFHSRYAWRFDLYDESPHNLLVVGDALSNSYPLARDGLTHGALDALQLEHTLYQHCGDPSPEGIQQLQKQLSRTRARRWQAPLGPVSAASPLKSYDLSTLWSRYVHTLRQVAAVHPAVNAQLLTVETRLKPRHSLLKPHVILGALTASNTLFTQSSPLSGPELKEPTTIRPPAP